MARASKYEDVKGDVLDKIGAAAISHGKPPSVRDLAAAFEVSVSTMHSYLSKLAEEGKVEWRSGRHRSLRLTPEGFQASSLQVP